MKNRFTHVTVHIHPLCAESYALCSVFLAVGGFKQCNKKWCQQVCLMYVFLPIIVSLPSLNESAIILPYSTWFFSFTVFITVYITYL